MSLGKIAINILTRKPTGNVLIRSLRRRLKDNATIDVKE